MVQDFWKWPETSGSDKNVNFKKAKSITAGIDVGAVSTQAAVLVDGQLFAWSNIRTGSDSAASAQKALDKALAGTGMTAKDIQFTVSTGYGRNNVASAQRTVNEVIADVQGARFMFGPSVRTIVDMGGQTSKVIKATEWGKAVDLFVNDKCATGFGRGVETMAQLMQVPITEMGELSLKVEKDPEPVSTTCYVFANTQAVGLLRAGSKESDALAAYLFAVAYRLYTLAGRMKIEQDVALIGGLAKNVGVTKRFIRELKGGSTNFNVEPLTTKYDVQLAGAIGSAVLAAEFAKAPKAAPAKPAAAKKAVSARK
jgi:predicted CoA-substrate-specific enzyme activase